MARLSLQTFCILAVFQSIGEFNKKLLMLLQCSAWFIIFATVCIDSRACRHTHMARCTATGAAVRVSSSNKP